MADRGRDHDAIRNVGTPSAPEASRPGRTPSSGHSQPVDAGKSSGGGNSGHDQPGDAASEVRIRNQRAVRDGAALRDREPPEPAPELKP
jgi:hypothetical protein